MTVFVADARISRACHNTTFVLMLSLIFLIRGVLSSFPLSEILPPEGKLKIFAHESKAKLVSEMAQQPAWHSVNDRTSDIEVRNSNYHINQGWKKNRFFFNGFILFFIFLL